MKTIVKFATITAVCVLTNTGGAFAADDKKTLPGYACQPRFGHQVADFKRVGGSIANIHRSKRRVVACPILRDKILTSTSAEY